jgi:hypothetical protein
MRPLPCPAWFLFESPNLQNFELIADPDPAFHFNADPVGFPKYCGSMQIRIRNPAI